jgi:hypothetical protein
MAMRIRLALACTVAALALLAFAGLAGAADGGRPLSATLTGAAEIGGGDPDGSGTARLFVNPGQEEICYTLSVANLDPVTAAHIHAAPAGVNGPVVVPLVAPTSGTSSGCAQVDRALALAILAHPEAYYVNVHTTAYPGGAVRGQLAP